MMKTLTYFVPIDFSEASYNALQYASMLARESEGCVKLCHVVDLTEVPESENPVVVSFALDKILKNASSKLKSLREFISLDAINVDEDMVMGHVTWTLINRIEKIKPDVIVIGRKTDSKIHNWSITHHITRNTSTPVLVIPQSYNPHIPNRAALKVDVNPEVVVRFKTLLTIIKKISPEISILYTNESKRNGAVTDWIEDLRVNYGIKAHFLSNGNNSHSGSLDEFIRENQIDFLYNIKPRKNLMTRLLDKIVNSPGIDSAEVPYLIYNLE